MKNSLTRRIKGVLPPFVGMRTNIIATLLVLPALVLAQSTGVSHEIFVINPTSRVQQTASCILTGNTYYGDGSGLTGITATAETDPAFTNWLATNTYIETESDPVWVAASGAVWAAIGAAVSGVTNTYGYTPSVSTETITVTRASGSLLAYTLTNNTVITAQMADWPTNENTTASIIMHLDAFSYTVTISTSTFYDVGVASTTNIAVETNATTTLMFFKGWKRDKFNVLQF